METNKTELAQMKSGQAKNLHRTWQARDPGFADVAFEAERLEDSLFREMCFCSVQYLNCGGKSAVTQILPN